MLTFQCLFGTISAINWREKGGEKPNNLYIARARYRIDSNANDPEREREGEREKGKRKNFSERSEIFCIHTESDEFLPTWTIFRGPRLCKRARQWDGWHGKVRVRQPVSEEGEKSGARARKDWCGCGWVVVAASWGLVVSRQMVKERKPTNFRVALPPLSMHVSSKRSCHSGTNLSRNNKQYRQKWTPYTFDWKAKREIGRVRARARMILHLFPQRGE